jgi:putative secretion ATPase (PEP-CTERM system associated)
MYESFYQLSADPFRLSPDPAFCFPHRTYRKAMTYMLHALHRAEGFIMITGRPGTGKTTLINDLIQTLKPDQAVVAKIVSTQLTADDLLNLVAYSFNLNPEGCGKAKVLIQVERFLKQQYQIGRRPLLIVDEAQDMGDVALEELRLLTNIQLGTRQLLQVFLVGQEQLRDTVNTPSLEQLHQRLIAATLLEPLDTDDTKTYIKHRLRCVNWKGDPLISTQTYAMIRRYSQGIPRRINQICSRLFLYGCIEEKHRLGLADLKIVVEELQHELLLPKDKEGIDEAAPGQRSSMRRATKKSPRRAHQRRKPCRQPQEL